MNRVARAIFIAGIAFVLLAAIGTGIGTDAKGLVIVALIVGVGLLGFALLARSGKVQPAHCPECEGLISPHAPYCKHCGAQIGKPGSLPA